MLGLPARARPARRRCRRPGHLAGARRGWATARLSTSLTDRRRLRGRAVPVHAAAAHPSPSAGRACRAARGRPGRQADAADGAGHHPRGERGLRPGRGAPSRFNTSPRRRPLRSLRPPARLGQSGPARRQRCSAAAASSSSPGATTTAATARRLGSATGSCASRIGPRSPAWRAASWRAFLADRQRPIKEALLEGDLARARRLVNGGAARARAVHCRLPDRRRAARRPGMGRAASSRRGRPDASVASIAAARAVTAAISGKPAAPVTSSRASRRLRRSQAARRSAILDRVHVDVVGEAQRAADHGGARRSPARPRTGGACRRPGPRAATPDLRARRTAAPGSRRRSG